MGTGIARLLGKRIATIRRASAAVLALAFAMACQWDRSYDSPYLPGDDEYPGDEWAHDGDGDGIADSVQKYLPGCSRSPGRCLGDARILKGIPEGKSRLRARDLVLWKEDGPVPAALEWTPAESALRARTLSSSDLRVVSLRGDTLVPAGPGECRITIVAHGPDDLRAEFKVRVLTGGIRVKSVRAADLLLLLNAAAAPNLEWSPADATLKDYLLSVEPESVAVVEGGRIRALRPGRARAELAALDGGRRAAFTVTVVSPPSRSVLTAGPMRLVAGDPAAAPDLFWDPPEAGSDGYRLTLADTSVAGLDAQARKVIPLRPGTSSARAISLRGDAEAEFPITVVARRVAVAGLAADDLAIATEDAPAAPVLHWEPADATDQGYALSTRDSAIAVPFGGRIKPIAPGKTVFTATSHDGGFAAEFEVKVAAGPGPDPDPDPDPDPRPDPDSITGLTVSALSLLVGEDKAPSFAWTPAFAPKPAYSLRMEDSAIAEVIAAEGGPRIRGKRPGASVAVLRAGEGPSVAFLVTVAARPVSLVSIEAADFSLELGAAPYVPAIAFTPSDADDRTYALMAPDSAGAIRIEGNKVVPVRAGKSPLRITPGGNPDAAITCSVTVTARVLSITAKDDTLRPAEERISMAGRLAWNPSDASDRRFLLISLSPDTVKILPGDTAYRGVAPGKAKVIVKALDGSGALDTFTVLVRIPLAQIIAKDLAMKTGDPVLNPWFLFTFVPSNASNQGWSFEYLSPDTDPPARSVVEIVENWKLLAKAPGVARLAAYSLDNRALKDTFTVTVLRPVQSLSADTAALNLVVGEPDVIPAVTVLPADATVKTWRLTSSNPSIVSVAGTQSLHPLRAGTAAVTAVSDDNPSAKVVLNVRVRAPAPFPPFPAAASTAAETAAP